MNPLDTADLVAKTGEVLRQWEPSGHPQQGSLIRLARQGKWSEARELARGQEYARLILASAALVLGNRDLTEQICASLDKIHNIGAQGYARCLVALLHDQQVQSARELYYWALPGKAIDGEPFFHAICRAGDPRPSKGIRQHHYVIDSLALHAEAGCSAELLALHCERVDREAGRGRSLGFKHMRCLELAMSLARAGHARAAITLARDEEQKAMVGLILARSSPDLQVDELELTQEERITLLAALGQIEALNRELRQRKRSRSAQALRAALLLGATGRGADEAASVLSQGKRISEPELLARLAVGEASGDGLVQALGHLIQVPYINEIWSLLRVVRNMELRGNVDFAEDLLSQVPGGRCPEVFLGETLICAGARGSRLMPGWVARLEEKDLKGWNKLQILIEIADQQAADELEEAAEEIVYDEEGGVHHTSMRFVLSLQLGNFTGLKRFCDDPRRLLSLQAASKAMGIRPGEYLDLLRRIPRHIASREPVEQRDLFKWFSTKVRQRQLEPLLSRNREDWLTIAAGLLEGAVTPWTLALSFWAADMAMVIVLR